ncbi:MAG: hypothetical protein ACJ74Z_18670 [Bryobacteraceae bacterium]
MRLNSPPLLSGILELIRNIPEELLVMSSLERGQFIAVSALEFYTTRGLSDPNGFAFPIVGETIDCVPLVRATLGKCPDEAPSTSTAGLMFIDNQQLRDGLLVDLGSAERALNSGEWKAATVLGGSVIEALLLWAL